MQGCTTTNESGTSMQKFNRALKLRARSQEYAGHGVAATAISKAPYATAAPARRSVNVYTKSMSAGSIRICVNRAGEIGIGWPREQAQRSHLPKRRLARQQA